MKSITMICIDTINQDVSIKVMNRMLDIFGHRIDKNIFLQILSTIQIESIL